MYTLCTGTMSTLRRFVVTMVTAGIGCIVYGQLFYRSLITEGYSNLMCSANGLYCTPSPVGGPGNGPGSGPGNGPGSWPGSVPSSGHRQDTTNYQLHPRHNALLEQTGRVKKIAFGSSYWRKFLNWKNVFNRFTDGGCPVSSCIFSYDWKGTVTADALIFNAADLTQMLDMAKNKNPRQFWVWFSDEPPPVLNLHTAHFWSFYDVFDWTMSYRLDSDVFMPYGSFIPIGKDYVTEKFYKVLKLDVVPVVFGSANYSAIAPPNSFINALDFASPKALAMYLKGVAASEQLYNSFFEWKT